MQLNRFVYFFGLRCVSNLSVDFFVRSNEENTNHFTQFMQWAHATMNDNHLKCAADHDHKITTCQNIYHLILMFGRCRLPMLVLENTNVVNQRAGNTANFCTTFAMVDRWVVILHWWNSVYAIWTPFDVSSSSWWLGADFICQFISKLKCCWNKVYSNTTNSVLMST